MVVTTSPGSRSAATTTADPNARIVRIVSVANQSAGTV